MRARESNPITNSVPRCNPISHVYLFKGVTASGLKIHKSLGISSKWPIQCPSSSGRASVDTFQCCTQDKIVCLLITNIRTHDFSAARRWRWASLHGRRLHLPTTMATQMEYRIFVGFFFNPSRKKCSYISCQFVIYHWPDHSLNLPEQQTQQLRRKDCYFTPLCNIYCLIY